MVDAAILELTARRRAWRAIFAIIAIVDFWCLSHLCVRGVCVMVEDMAFRHGHIAQRVEKRAECTLVTPERVWNELCLRASLRSNAPERS